MIHMKSFMGPAEVAAWGILGYLWEVFEYMTGKDSISTFASIIGLDVVDYYNWNDD